MDTILHQQIAFAGHMVVRAESAGLAAARARVRTLAREIELGPEESTDLLIAVGEAMSNAYFHGTPDRRNGFIYIDWHYAHAALTVAVEDDGPGLPADLDSLDRRASEPDRGRGIGMMRKCVDKLEFDFDHGRKVVLTKRVA